MKGIFRLFHDTSLSTSLPGSGPDCHPLGICSLVQQKEEKDRFGLYRFYKGSCLQAALEAGLCSNLAWVSVTEVSVDMDSFPWRGCMLGLMDRTLGAKCTAEDPTLQKHRARSPRAALKPS
jgi:hypothetical protein